ncbi:MAG TPA: hypothetical protein VIK45_15455 [Candidatus Dormibacteraeota bacterium]|jgi:hypothetical protein
MSTSRKGSALAGGGVIAFVTLTVVAFAVGSPAGGNYSETDVANYVSIGHLPMVIVSGYLALLGVFGLICFLAFLRGAISAQPGRELAGTIFWGAGLAAASSLAVGWGLVTGIAVAAAEGGSANSGNGGTVATITHAETYVLSDTTMNVLYGSGGILLGFALIALAKASAGVLPGWLRWLTLIVGILALASPAFLPAFAIPVWGIVIGVRLIAAGRFSLPAAAPQPAA